MPKSRLFLIICVSLLIVFVYGCNKGSIQTETAEASTQEHEKGEQEGEVEKGEHEEAITWLNKALLLADEIGDPVNERYHQMNLGKCNLAIGKPSDAVPHFEKAIEITCNLGMADEYIEVARNNLDRAKEACQGING